MQSTDASKTTRCPRVEPTRPTLQPRSNLDCPHCRCHQSLNVFLCIDCIFLDPIRRLGYSHFHCAFIPFHNIRVVASTGSSGLIQVYPSQNPQRGAEASSNSIPRLQLVSFIALQNNSNGATVDPQNPETDSGRNSGGKGVENTIPFDSPIVKGRAVLGIPNRHRHPHQPPEPNCGQ